MSKVIQLHRRKFIAGGVLIGMTILLFYLRFLTTQLNGQLSLIYTLTLQAPGL